MYSVLGSRILRAFLSKALSNVLVTLTLPLTHVKDEVKSVVAVTTWL